MASCNHHPAHNGVELHSPAQYHKNGAVDESAYGVGMQTLQDHFVEAMAAQGRGDSAAASLHDGVVTAALGKTYIHQSHCLQDWTELLKV